MPGFKSKNSRKGSEKPRVGKKIKSATAKKKTKRSQGMRSVAENVLTQNVGCAPQKAFGDKADKGTLACWDAKMPHHLPLPRAVGPYTVIRTTRRLLTNKAVNVLGTFMTKRITGTEAGPLVWSSVCMVGDIDRNLDVNGTNNAIFETLPMQGLGNAATVCPSAFTVQVMNPQALQTSHGIVYAGVMNTQAAIANRAEPWETWANKFVQFQSPRLLSAGKLVLRGVQIDSYPLNMSEVSNFTPIQKDTDENTTYSAMRPEPRGWAPIVIYNAGAGGDDGLQLELLITTEWRVRFDLDNPASASHIHHPIVGDTTWDRLMKQASALGHGVKDIAEIVGPAYHAVRAAFA